MTVKTITITEQAYGSLKSLKGEQESFSDIINRLTKRRSVLEFAGILSKETGDHLEKAISEGRKKHREQHKTRDKRLWGV